MTNLQKAEEAYRKALERKDRAQPGDRLRAEGVLRNAMNNLLAAQNAADRRNRRKAA